MSPFGYFNDTGEHHGNNESRSRKKTKSRKAKKVKRLSRHKGLRGK